ncbi:MAG: helix-turn-helix domain-containing protein [Pseudonocardia sp.]|nr:helix-turn-helix domain-containing protein [Pseudonocardia sp.]
MTVSQAMAARATRAAGEWYVGDTGDGQGAPTFATLLDALIRTVHPGQEDAWTNERVAEGLQEVGGPTLSTAYIQQLRRGRRDNPSFVLVLALARLFSVPVSYFAGDQDGGLSEDDLHLLNAARTPELRELVIKLDGIGTQARQVISRLVDGVGALDQGSGRRD